jgi:hypothetical protein
MTDFGTDITCTDSLKTGRFSSGVQLVAEAVYRRLITRRGSLLGGKDEEEYGLDLAGYLGATSDLGLAATLPGLVKGEILKDERLNSADVVVTPSATGDSWLVQIVGYTDAGPFDLVLSVSGVTVSMVGLEVGS